MRFDRILGRNAFSGTAQGDLANRPAVIALAVRLLPGGRLVLAQAIPRHTQRLYDLVSWGRATALREKVVAAEEAIYADAADPLVNWDADDLRAALEAAGLSDVRVHVETQPEERLLSAGPFKRGGMRGAETTADHAAEFARQAQRTFDLFRADVLKVRDNVPATAMQGQVFDGAEAKRSGLVDAPGDLNYAKAGACRLTRRGQRPGGEKKKRVPHSTFAVRPSTTSLYQLTYSMSCDGCSLSSPSL